MKGFVVAFILLLSQFSWAQDDLGKILERYNSNSVSYILVTELNELQKSGEAIVILDAREPNEFSTSHLKGARYIGYNDFNAERLARLDLNKETPIVVYCTIGVRSENIGEKLLELGFKQVYNLWGGIVSWKNTDFNVYNNSGTVTDSVHVYGKSWDKWLTNGIGVYDK